MSSETHVFFVKSRTPPVIELDSEAQAIYVRFGRAKVAKTIGRQSHGMICAVDLDGAGNVVGIEAVGNAGMRLDKLFEVTNVSSRNIDLSKATIRPTVAPCAA